jgi:phosphoribosylamine--glycine ligase
VNTLIVGHGGREAALGTRMAASSSLFAFMGHANPTISSLVEGTGGAILIGDVCDGASIARFAVDHAIDVAMVSADDPLAAGVVDALSAAGVAAVGPTRAGAQIEWDKHFSRTVVTTIAPGANPRWAHASTVEEARAAVERVGAGGVDVVVKPVGLAGGKGVKVVGPHLADNHEATRYACEVIGSGRHGGAVIVEERIRAPEFTIQAMTDGRHTVFPPATFDYPYRYDDDRGPGTGGMGSCTLPGGLFPFLDAATYDQACGIVADAIGYLTADGRSFTGCMNAGFFVTGDGLRVIEFNARFGDPEALNIMSLFDGDWTEVMEAMVSGTLHDGQVPLSRDASVVVYLVSPEYAVAPGQAHEFTVDDERIAGAGASVLFSAAERVGPGRFRTVGTSRAVAVVARAPSLGPARDAAYRAIGVGIGGDLQWRTDLARF